MKRLLVTGSVFSTQQFGGVSRYLVELARGVEASSDWNARVAAPLYVNHYLREYKSPLHHHGIYFRHRKRGLSRLNDFIVKTLMPSSLHNADVVHEGFFDASTLRQARGARIATVYDMISERFFPSESSLRKKQQTADAADRLVAISEATKNDVCHYLDVAPEKVEVIYLAANMRPNTAKSKLVPDRPYLLWVGTREGYKNFGALIESLGKSKRFGSDCVLVCAGGPPLSQQEQQSWHDAGLDEHSVLHCRPQEHELASLYSHAETLVYVSQFEGFGIPPLEAMQCDCPVIASNRSSIPEVVGQAAELVNPDDTESIADAIDRVIEQPSLVEHLKDKGRLQASRFTWEKCVSQHLGLYQEALQQRGGL
ncbi:glycosyltransferase family 4 protein [Stieleria magnilauensis]|uniref:Alpha-D-kanosaminyltransferase n=1 Tax=Stieleria magnilauensis TaxID=2527963 RepID=A0ABX5XI64_9BACT|nr:Alpha-D-kanosaminyltransferase [Planctomycetes bacterium TBK1r]